MTNPHEARLEELVPKGEGTPFGLWQDVRVRGLSTDSRRTSPGDLFVGLPGGLTHGGLYAAQALSCGAAAVVLPPGLEPPPGAVGLWHERPFTLLAEAALRFYRQPARSMTVVGVTGTNGKTTTALLVAHLLAAAGNRCAYWTTTLVRLPHVNFRPQWTTPPAHELQRFLASALERGHDHAVLEVSSHAVRQERVRGVAFRAGVATNFSPDHLDYHGSVEDYYEAKRDFIRGLPAGAAAVLSADDPRIFAMGAGVRADVVSFGEDVRADVRLRELSQQDGELTGSLLVQRRDLASAGPFPFRLPMPGRHNGMNAAAAFAVAVHLGIPPEEAAAAFRSFTAPPRRLERQDVGPYVIYNDVAMNEASYHAVLRTIRDLGPRQVVVVCALRGNRGAEVNARIASILAGWEPQLGYAPLIVSESRSDLREYAVDYQVRADEIAAFSEAARQGGLALSRHLELPSAIEEAVGRLAEGGVLLLLGTFGMDRGPAIARALLSKRLGLPDERKGGYLEPHEADY